MLEVFEDHGLGATRFPRGSGQRGRSFSSDISIDPHWALAPEGRRRLRIRPRQAKAGRLHNRIGVGVRMSNRIGNCIGAELAGAQIAGSGEMPTGIGISSFAVFPFRKVEANRIAEMITQSQANQSPKRV